MSLVGFIKATKAWNKKGVCQFNVENKKGFQIGLQMFLHSNSMIVKKGTKYCEMVSGRLRAIR